MKIILIILILTSLISAFPALVIGNNPDMLKVRKTAYGKVVGSIPIGEFAVVVNIDGVENDWCHFNSLKMYSYENGKIINSEQDIPLEGYVSRKSLGILLSPNEIEMGSDGILDDNGFSFYFISKIEGNHCYLSQTSDYTEDSDFVIIPIEKIQYPFPRDYPLRKENEYINVRARSFADPPVQVYRSLEEKPYDISISNNCKDRYDYFYIYCSVKGVQKDYLYYNKIMITGSWEGNDKYDCTFDIPEKGLINVSDVVFYLRTGRGYDNREIQLYKIPGLKIKTVNGDFKYKVLDIWRQWIKLEIDGDVFWMNENDICLSNVTMCNSK